MGSSIRRGNGPLGIDKKTLSKRDICTKFITPALEAAGWDVATQIREEVTFTKGRIIVRGKLATRGKPRRADSGRRPAPTTSSVTPCAPSRSSDP